MMAWFAAGATEWVKKDSGIDLDYSLESIKVIEEELGRISGEVNGANPQEGTFGVALGYGAYIGEVFKRRDGGSWAVDHPAAGQRSYPLTTKSNVTMFPVGWCWKRLTVGEEDNVYHKALSVAQAGSLVTNVVGGDLEGVQVQGTRGEPSGQANRSRPSGAETNGMLGTADPPR